MRTHLPDHTLSEMETTARNRGQASAIYGDLFLTIFPVGTTFTYRLNGQEIPSHIARANLEHMLRRAGF